MEPTNGIWRLLDPAAFSNGWRFYRAEQLPCAREGARLRGEGRLIPEGLQRETNDLLSPTLSSKGGEGEYTEVGCDSSHLESELE